MGRPMAVTAGQGDCGRSRPFASAAVILLVALIASLSVADVAEAGRCAHRSAAPGQVSMGKLEKAIVCLINNKRGNKGRRQLERHKSLGRAASRHTRTMLSRDCYSHQCPGEPSLAGRLFDSGYLPAPKPRFGETIGIHQTARRVVAEWMASGAHRRILLGGAYRHIGVGAGEGVPISGYRDGGILTATAVVGRRG